jgi:hypothetical protein
MNSKILNEFITPPPRPENLPTPTHTPTIRRVEPVTRRLSFSPEMTPEAGEVNVNDITVAYVESTVNANGQTTLKHLIATNEAFENLQERHSVRSWFEYIENWRQAHRAQFGHGRWPSCSWFLINGHLVIIVHSWTFDGVYEHYLTMDEGVFNMLVTLPGFHTLDYGYEYEFANGNREWHGQRHQHREPLRLPIVDQTVQHREPLRLPIVDRAVQQREALRLPIDDSVPTPSHVEAHHSSNLDSPLPSLDLSFIEQLDGSPMYIEMSPSSLLGFSPPAVIPVAVPSPYHHMYVDTESFLLLETHRVAQMDDDKRYAMYEKHRDFFENGRAGLFGLELIRAVEFRKLSVAEDKCFILYHTNKDGDLCLTMDSDAFTLVNIFAHARRPKRPRRDAAMAASLRIFQMYYK